MVGTRFLSPLRGWENFPAQRTTVKTVGYYRSSAGLQRRIRWWRNKARRQQGHRNEICVNILVRKYDQFNTLPFASPQPATATCARAAGCPQTAALRDFECL